MGNDKSKCDRVTFTSWGVKTAWIDAQVAEELRKRLLPGEKVIWRTAFRWCDDHGALTHHLEQASIASLAAEFGYTVMVDAGCAAIIRDPRASAVPHDASKEGQPRLFAKGQEAIRDSAETRTQVQSWFVRHAISELNISLGKAFPDDQVSAIRAQDATLPLVSRLAERLVLMDKNGGLKHEGDSHGHREALAIQMLVNAGFVTAEKANEALQIAFGGQAGPLKPSVNRSWWEDVKPETDLANANEQIGFMLEDWQKVGEALGFKDFVDPESIISICKELFKEAPNPDATEALALLNGVIDKFKFDDEHGVETDLRSLRRLLTAGFKCAEAEEAAADDFADIREFRRREAEMDRRDAERAAAAHETAMRGMFQRKADAAAVPHISGDLQPFPFDGVPRDGSIPVYAGDPEFDALPIGAGSIPETPVPMAAEKISEDNERWKVDLIANVIRDELGCDYGATIERELSSEDVDDVAKRVVHALRRRPIAVAEHDRPDSTDPMDVIRQALEPVSAEEFERLVISIIVAETRYPKHHFNRAAKMITELHTRGYFTRAARQNSADRPD